MTPFYSASTGGFYMQEIHGDNMPQDAIEIDYVLYVEVVNDRPANKTVVAGPGGLPILADIPATVPASCTSLEYLDRFTQAEQESVVTAGMTNAAVRLWYDKLIAAQEVVFADQRVSAGLDALISAGLLAADRKAVLLTP